MKFAQLASQESIEKTIAALAKNGISAELVASKTEAKDQLLALLPEGAEVMTMTSITLDQIGVVETINDSGKYDPVKKKLMSMNKETQGSEMKKLGCAPEWAVGSVHAITENGEVLIASNTGSQQPAYVYGANHVIWVASTKKIVKDVNEGQQRIQEYIVPQESVRARKAYGLPDTWDTFVSKLLIVNREVTPNRIHIIFVNEDLGF